MRLWHVDLIHKLPRQQLLCQWREGWCAIGVLEKHGEINHSTVNYINEYPKYFLYAYGLVVADEMMSRGYKPNEDKLDKLITPGAVEKYNDFMDDGSTIYPEHNDAYYRECIHNLLGKGIDLTHEQE